MLGGGRGAALGALRISKGAASGWVGSVALVGAFRNTPDALIARIAARQHGLVTLEQLRACGLSRRAIDHRVASGRLFRLYRGVYAVGHNPLADHSRFKAATLAYAPNAVLLHRSAAELWGLLAAGGGDAHVTVPHASSLRPRPGVRLHRSRALAAARTTSRDGIPVTMPARTLADLARVAAPAEVRRATREGEIKNLPLDPDHVPFKTRSDLEDDFFAICRRFDVPLPEKNAEVRPYTVDFLWRAERLIVETDGSIYHRGRQAFRDDRDKDVELELLGFRVVRFDDTRIADDPAGIAEAVAAFLAAARARA